MATDLASYNQSRISPFDEYALTSLLKGMGDRKIFALEIGAWMGAGSTRILAEYADEVVCVDTWSGTENTQLSEIVSQVDPYSLFLENIREFEEKVTAIRTDSNEIGSLFEDETFDFIFIDGDHRYAQTKRDIHSCLPKLKRGGIIAGHSCEGRVSESNRELLANHLDVDHLESIFRNFRDMHPGVIIAVDEIFDDVELFADKTNLIVLDDETGKPRLGYSSIWYTGT